MTFSPVLANEYDFENNADTYYQMCSQSGLTDAQKDVCKLFQQYLSKNASDVQDKVSAAKKDLANIKSDLNKTIKEIEKFEALVANIEKQQAALEVQILEIETNIESLELQIEERTLRIQEIDEQLRIRMNNMQGIMSMNKYLEYLMGASDFADLIRRISALNQLYSYDASQMQLLKEEKVLLQADIENLQEQIAALEAQKELYETTKKSYEEAIAVQLELQARYYQEEARIEEENRKLEDELKEIKEQMKDIANVLDYIPPSAGWIYPIKERFSISSGAWYYPKSFGGGLHLGVDFAAGKTKHVVAPANGIVAYTYDKCTTGGLGNKCGVPSGGGNVVLLIVQVGKYTYGILNCHMSPGLDVKTGDIVEQGTILGNVGSTGNSSGPHLHHEIFYLGTMSMEDALARYKKYGVAFGAGWGSLNTTCEKRGIPCRLNPLEIYNVKQGKSYN